MKPLRRLPLDLAIPLYFPPMQAILQPGRKGIARIAFHEVSAAGALATLGGVFIPPGRYVRLYVNGKGVMTDEPHEHYTNLEVVRQARGDVLIAGLGLGMILTRILAKHSVHRVVVVERYQDVIDLVLPRLRKLRGYGKLSVECSNIFQYSTSARFDCIYHDITFDGPQATALRQRRLLHRRLRRWLKPDGWLGQWESIEWQAVLDQEGRR